MKFNIDKPDRLMTISGMVIAASAVAAYFICLNIPGIVGILNKTARILQPFTIGLALAFLVNLPMVFIENRLKKSDITGKLGKKSIRIISIAASLIMIFAVVALLIILIIPQLAASVEAFVSNAPDYIDKFNLMTESFAKRFNFGADITANLLPTIDQIVEYMTELISGSVPEVINISSQILSTVINVVVGLIICIYFLGSKERFFAQTKKILYSLIKKNRADYIIKISNLCNRTFTGFVSGKLIDSLMIGIISLVVLKAMRIPYALLICVIIAITNIIPFFGPIFGAIPSVLIVLMVDPLNAVLLLVYIIVLQQFDGNIMSPRILGDSTGLPRIWVVFAIIVGGGLFGFVGMLISVPTFAVIYAILKEHVETKTSISKQDPVSKKQDDS